MENKNQKENSTQREKEKRGLSRRDILKGFATLPVLSVFAHEVVQKISFDRRQKRDILAELGLKKDAPALLPNSGGKKSGELIRIGIVGFGARGEGLAKSMGYAHPEWVQREMRSAKQNKLDKNLADWLQQDDLNVELAGICDVFDMRAERGLETAKNEIRPQNAPPAKNVKRYRTYHEMLASDEIDAVIITTPDFHHAQMTIDAMNAGKHVYCEKCMTRTEDEVYHVQAAVQNANRHKNVVFQLGHQSTQNSSYAKAKEIVEKNILGKITTVETTTNRNTQWGAWIRHLDDSGNPKPGSPESIDWDQWLGSRPKVPFSIERYYNWTQWWDYATGLSGQLFSHEYDAVNQILNLGIPKSCVASGGIYFYDDNREIPDVFHATFEFPDKELTLFYSASLANSRSRPRVFMGHDGFMEVGATLKVQADSHSTRFAELIKAGAVNPSQPLFTFNPGSGDIDVVTTATEQYYATRGLIYTYRDGRRVDMAHLHIQNWLDCIRHGGTPGCGIDKAAEVTIACHMATKSYREKRRVEWDPVSERIV